MPCSSRNLLYIVTWMLQHLQFVEHMAQHILTRNNTEAIFVPDFSLQYKPNVQQQQQYEQVLVNEHALWILYNKQNCLVRALHAEAMTCSKLMQQVASFTQLTAPEIAEYKQHGLEAFASKYRPVIAFLQGMKQYFEWMESVAAEERIQTSSQAKQE